MAQSKPPTTKPQPNSQRTTLQTCAPTIRCTIHNSRHNPQVHYAIPPRFIPFALVACGFEAVPLIPVQLAMAAAQMRAREHLQMLKPPVIMQLQDQPLPQPPNTIHNVACAPFQAIMITFGGALLLCSSSMHPLIHLTTFKPVYRAQQQRKPRHMLVIGVHRSALRDH